MCPFISRNIALLLYKPGSERIGSSFGSRKELANNILCVRLYDKKKVNGHQTDTKRTPINLYNINNLLIMWTVDVCFYYTTHKEKEIIINNKEIYIYALYIGGI